MPTDATAAREWPSGCCRTCPALRTRPRTAVVGRAGRAGKTGTGLAAGHRRWPLGGESAVRPVRARPRCACRPRSRKRPAPRECRRRRCAAPPRDACSRPSAAARSGCMSGSTCVAPDSRLDPALVGAVVAAIHRVSVTDPGPLDPWYHEPVGADRWDELAGQLAEAGAPFARPARRPARRTGRAGSLDRASRDASDLSPRPVGRQRPANRGRRRVRHRLGEQRSRRPEPGARLRAVRVRPRRPGPGPRAGRPTGTPADRRR